MEVADSLKIEHLTCGYGKKQILTDISFEVFSGQIFCILGPNGVGKTTLFRTLLGFLPRFAGDILINEKDIHTIKQSRIAQLIAYVPQAHIPPFPYLVDDVVLMGRTARFKNSSTPKKEDREKVKEILERLQIEYLSNRVYTEISGGERQMVLIARALAQEPKFLIMDEPTSNLDFGNQIRVLEQVTRLRKQGMGIIMTTHHPDHAFLCSAKVLLIRRNQMFHVGECDEVLTETNLKEAYGIRVKIMDAETDNGQLTKTCMIQVS